MLARSYKTLSVISLSFILIACGRQDDLIIPAEVEPEPSPYCLEDSPYETPVLLDSVSFSGLPFSFDYRQFDYQFNLEHLSDLTTLGFVQVEQFFAPNVLPELTQADSLGETVLSTLQFERLDQAAIEVREFGVIVEHSHNNDTRQFDVDLSENTSLVDITLKPGKNEISLEVTASLQMPYSGLECELDERLRNLVLLDDGGESTEETQNAVLELQGMRRNVEQVLTYNFVIFRDEADELEITDFANPLALFDENSLESNNLSLSGDYLVLGSPKEDSSSAGEFTALQIQNDLDGSIVNEFSEDSGAVYIYERNANDSWELVWMLKAPNAEPGDKFGQSVFVDGELLVVSAPGEDSSAQDVYTNYTAEGDYSSALSQELENASASNLSPESGAVYLYVLQRDGSWALHSYIKAKENVRGASGFDKGFGEQIALSARLSSSGQYIGHSLAIAAPTEDSLNGIFSDTQAINSGAVYMYSLNLSQGNFLQYIETLKALEPVAGDRFGSAISLTPDGQVFVSAPYEQSNDRVINNSPSPESYEPVLSRSNSGAVFAFSATNSNQVGFHELSSIIKASNADSGDLFGSSIASNENYLVVSASHEDGASTGFNRDMSNNDSSDSGAVYVFKRDAASGNFSQDLYIKPPVNEPFSSFGNAVALYDNDLVVSHSLFDEGGTEDKGITYIYARDHEDNTWSKLLELSSPGVVEYGSTIALEGNKVVATTKTAGQPLFLVK